MGHLSLKGQTERQVCPPPAVPTSRNSAPHLLLPPRGVPPLTLSRPATTDARAQDEAAPGPCPAEPAQTRSVQNHDHVSQGRRTQQRTPCHAHTSRRVAA